MRKNKLYKRILAMSAALVLTLTSVPVSFVNSIAYTVTNGAVDGIAEDVSDVSAASDANNYTGVILHAWDWSFGQIKNEMADIAAAGYTAVQTSPIQPNKDGNDVPNTGAWWKFYQPTDFTIGNKLGTKEEFKAMCDEAHKYGLKVIVDVVSNHLANVTGNGGNDASDRSTQIPSYLKNNEDFWHHDSYSGSSDGDRYQMTRGPIGMPDLNTGNTALQDIIIKFLNDAQDCGADGFRFDAAKHIETPSDTGFSSEFWSRIAQATRAKDPDVFLYGEILNTAGPDNYSDMQKYTPYIKVTNNKYGINLQNAVKSSDVNGAKFMNNDIFGSNGYEWVLWNESHDTFAGDYGEKTWSIDDEKMMLAWCAVAARYPAALYFARPTGDLNGGWKSAPLGSHKEDYKNNRIAEMNKFHTAMDGEKEYVEATDNVLVVERGTGGVALVNFSGGSKSISATMHTVADGTYTDHVSGSTFTVSGGVLTGTIGSGGVAAIYNEGNVVKTPSPTISQEGGNFSSETLSLTIGLKNATSGTYQIGNEAAKSYTASTTITIGSGMSYGDSVTVKLTASADGADTVTKSYTFNKVEVTGNIAYLSLPSGWSEPVYCYAYDSATEKVNNGTWPGVKMTKDSASGYYMYQIPENIEKPRVIFYSSDTNRSPADMEKGYLFDTEGSYLYKDGSWKTYSVPKTKGTVTVKYVDEAGVEVAAAKTLTGNVGDSYQTTAAAVAGFTLKTTPANASGSYTEAAITVTYVYEAEVIGDKPFIDANVIDGTSFDTETTTVTFRVINAESGTYCVDNGPVKTFTDSADVVIGKGKIADSDVTVKVTATKGSETTEKTYTYKKTFNAQKNGASKEYLAESGMTEELDSASLAAPKNTHYATNPNGQMGQKKTITKASDFTSDMIIAQGVANDDPATFKGPHEAPKFDPYALYGAWDDNNLYLGIQYTNVTDVVAPEQKSPQTGRGKPNGADADIPQMIAFDLGTGDYTDGKTNDPDQTTVWNSNITFGGDAKVDKILMYSPKEGIDNWALFPVTNGVINYDKDKAIAPGYQKALAGASLTWEDTFIGSSMYGINSNGYKGFKPADLESESSAWVDFLTAGHSKAQDTFCILTFSLDLLGVTANDIANNGIGVMAVSTYGSSGIGSLPMDMTMLDVACEAYSKDDSTSQEKEDPDNITVPLARLGAEGGGNNTKSGTLSVNFGADRSAPQTAGTALSLQTKANGGSGSYTYEFLVDGQSVQAASAANTYAWNAASGTHKIKTIVTDTKYNVTVELEKEYDIESAGQEPAKTKITSADVTVSPASMTYTGEALKPSVTVTVSGKTLTAGTDYDISYTNNTAVAAADAANAPTVTVTGKNSYEGTVSKTFAIVASDPAKTKITDADVALAATSMTYTGQALKPAVTVTVGGKTLAAGTDYDVNYTNNIQAASASGANAPTVTVTGKGTYEGTVTKTFTITAPVVVKKTITDEGVTLATTSMTYTGNACKPDVTVIVDNTQLTYGRDYTVTYSNNVNAAKADAQNAPTVTVTGTGNYEGTVTKTFTIVAADQPKTQITDADVALTVTSLTYTGNPLTPGVTVTVNGTKLSYGTDYEVGYTNNVNVAAADAENAPSVTVTAKGNYEGTVTKKFTIVAASQENPATKTAITEFGVTISPESMTYTGQELKPQVTVVVNGKTLTQGTDYEVSYANNVNVAASNVANAPTVTVSGKGNYEGTVTKRFTIVSASQQGGNETPVIVLTSENVSIDPVSTTYTGKAITPAVKVTVNGKVLTKDTDYEVSYANNTDAAAANVTNAPSVIVQGKGNYSGMITKTFTILPATQQGGNEGGQTGGDSTKTKITDANVTLAVTSMTYTGNALTPAVTVKVNNTVLKYGADYRVSYSNNIQVASDSAVNAPTVTVTGAGNYEGTVVKKFSIVAAGQQGGQTGGQTGGTTGGQTGGTTGGQTGGSTGGQTGGTTGGQTGGTTGGQTGGSTGIQAGETDDTEELQPGDISVDSQNKALYRVTGSSSVEYSVPSKKEANVTVPDTVVLGDKTYKVTTVADNAFKNNKNIKTIKIGSNVKTIDDKAFYGCKNLTKVVLNAKVTKIGSKAFYKCTALTEITIPSKVSKIGPQAFYGCKNLKKISIKTTKLTKSKVGSKAFKGISSKAKIKVPASKLKTYKRILRAKGVSAKASITK